MNICHTCQVGTDQVGTDQVGTDQVGTDQVGTDQVGTDQVGTDQVGTEQVGTELVGTEDPTGMTIDELAAAAGTTTRRIRSLQTFGLLPHPELQGRAGVYGARHRHRLSAVLRLQDEGFSLESLRVLLEALDAGRSLAAVLGLPGPPAGASGSSDPVSEPEMDTAELYGFAELQPSAARLRRRPLLSVVPTTVWDESEAS
jgi:DNA-binding transcriptional MerR regulator